MCKLSKDPLFFQAESKLANILKGKENYLKSELENAPSIDHFCQQIFYLVSKMMINQPSSNIFPNSTFFQRVLDEIREIGWDLVSNIDPTLSFFEVIITDKKGRKIEVRFDFQPTFPKTPPKVTTNLPITPKYEWDSTKSHLVSIIEIIKDQIPLFEPLWSQLEELDREAFVIEPREPSLNCCIRRIVLTNQVQLQLELSPKRPMHPPKVVFIGAEEQSQQMREKYQKGKWRIDISLMKNIENILEMKLPKRDSEEMQETDFDCGICYLERLGGELPEIICGNPKCAKRFHRSCLSDWLRTKRDSEQSYQYIFGNCPFCSHPIQCSLMDNQ
ncbi:E3 ubiquitin-protein ligase FANCL [Histomonas meleagridis]|uniref:E3 ubiquitin-protein ligase FANCL n=1 Tax=Histomonas meleagridis TaxID=135588 RepID=UPI0035595834|nr:E3 ubiquitin-protein ligase FANCL [Histomonas meleagridis]KAH0797166.1 E3 ubiquitin-protein ligase FANCL [Histomonas meleagridis]